MSTLHVLDVDSGKELRVPKLPAGVITNLRWHEDNRDLAFSLNTSRSPSDVYSVDIQTAKLDRWTISETGGFQPKNRVEPTLTPGKSFEGKKFPGGLSPPKDT